MADGEYSCVDGSEIAPAPWKVVPYPVPYYTWIMDATGGIVCMGFGLSNQNLLLHARDLLEMCERVLRDEGSFLSVETYDALLDVTVAARGRAT